MLAHKLGRSMVMVMARLTRMSAMGPLSWGINVYAAVGVCDDTIRNAGFDLLMPSMMARDRGATPARSVFPEMYDAFRAASSGTTRMTPRSKYGRPLR